MLAPKGTPKVVVDKLNRQIAEAIADPAVMAKLKDLGALPTASTPTELQQFISSETVKWREVLTRTGITIEQ